METITNIIDHTLNMEKYSRNHKVCFMDIETTGLNRNNSVIYLIGLLYFNEDIKSWMLIQYFANSLNKELDVLNKFIDDLSIFDKIITFNGDSFDIPFIEHRLRKYNINYVFDKEKSFDLYQIIKKNRYYLNLPNLKLKTIERSLGFIREDKYTGGDCIKFYYDYIKSKDVLLKEDILKHNYDDLVHMLDIIVILDILDEKKSLYIDLIGKSTKLTIESINKSGDILNISGILDTKLKNNIKYYGEGYSIITEGFNKFNLSIEFKEGFISKEQKCIYIDTNYIYDLQNLRDLTEYKLPPHIIILTIEKEYCIDNIKNLIKEIFKNIL
ncbi:ribonuclease H-like domain-containing protein [Tissierella sp. MB52-C2]|uniref:ribonuclease H-like domain-containing protein n=1 Tax=Tissierella sp. MB52-C2 TaxID=3070999 RepID=UPI00280A7DC4|nr:ribonuclease H-like domain-containing protein [Tissierella sp. MB52-C2]WMM23629.1 ribonuclease H-like domain-containing protein [Tissierella sp. MB52-C2]